MLAIVLFYAALAIGIFIFIMTIYFTGNQETKRGVTMFPFLLLLAAAVAKYLGL